MNENRRKTKLGLFIILAAVITLVLSCTATASAATGLNVDTHSPEEIRAYFNRIESNSSFAVTYDQQPVLTGPDYAPGSLSQSTLQGAVDMLNGMRYIAGVPYNV